VTRLQVQAAAAPCRRGIRFIAILLLVAIFATPVPATVASDWRVIGPALGPLGVAVTTILLLLVGAFLIRRMERRSP
jgi:hypothetical protein